MNAGIMLLSIIMICSGLSAGGEAPFSSVGHSGTPTMRTITVEQNGADVEVEENSTFRIELQSVGSAGYKWYVDTIDARYIEITSETTEDGSAKGMTGAPVMQVFQLHAKGEGQTELRLLYYRVWEGKGKAAKSFSIRIHITKAGNGT